ncbi:hypothetical protein [Budvicia aquatica]|uniref:Immunity protein 26 n=1 Tax=Budvicia aquatica TaxID=82979 RepID=A0A2C6DRA8_9GAMM|nr:hypothetical protein [Budvicia aquatica]PHI31737.1 hypothetical protein CRN84_21600 [Budvicia aquatica]VFS52603.1 Uncharacterised protein [Budvicia aquatica]
MTTKISVGDVIMIPIAKVGIVPAQVLFVSKKYKNVIQMGVYQTCLTSSNDEFNYSDSFCELIYTSQEMIKKGDWILIGNHLVAEQYKDSSLRNVAGSLYINDDFIRRLAPDEYSKYPKMLVSGRGAVENRIRKNFPENILDGNPERPCP